MKICSSCKVYKPFNEFSIRKSVKSGLYSKCKSCRRIKAKKDYHLNPKKKLDECKQKVEHLRSVINQIKDEQGCKVCGEKDIVCLDFHHLQKNKKDLSISRLVWIKNEHRMMNEIKKCIVVCSNCHRKIHAGKIKYNGELPDR